MNEELKTTLQGQGMRMSGAVRRYEHAKGALDLYDAQNRIKVKADGVKRTESEVDALVVSAEGRGPLTADLIDAKAELEGVKTASQCVLAECSLICSETAAMSRIAGQ